jgi:hypothetical protein
VCGKFCAPHLNPAAKTRQNPTNDNGPEPTETTQTAVYLAGFPHHLEFARWDLAGKTLYTAHLAGIA